MEVEGAILLSEIYASGDHFWDFGKQPRCHPGRGARARKGATISYCLIHNIRHYASPKTCKDGARLTKST